VIEELDPDDGSGLVHRLAPPLQLLMIGSVDVDDVRNDRQHDQDSGDDETAAADHLYFSASDSRFDQTRTQINFRNSEPIP